MSDKGAIPQPSTAAASLGHAVESKQIEDRTEKVHYQLYKLLAFAIQELSFFASSENISNALSLPKPVHTLSNRAQMAVDRIERQNPHFFSGYIKYRRGKPYPPREEPTQ